MEKATEKWNLVTEQLPSHASITPVAHYFAAFGSFRLGRYTEAIRHCRSLVERYPDSEYAWRAQALLAKIFKWQVKEGTLSEDQAQDEIQQVCQTLLEKYPASPPAGVLRRQLLSSEYPRPTRSSDQGGEK